MDVVSFISITLMDKIKYKKDNLHTGRAINPKSWSSGPG
jgi:hypothetical protein